MIIDCHAHVFQNWKDACGHPSIEIHLKYLQKVVTRPAARAFRARDGAEVKPHMLFRPDDNSWTGLTDVGFRVGRYGQLQFTFEGDDYFVQYMPVGMQEIEAPPELMIAQMIYAGVDHCILQTGGGYGAMNDYNAFTQNQYPERFSALLQVDEAVADREDALFEFDRAAGRLGLKGVCYAQDFSRHGYARNLDHADFAPFWERVSASKLPVFIELSSTPSYDRAGYIGNLLALDTVMQRLPGTRFLLVMGPPVAHFGASGRWEFPPEVLAPYKRDNLQVEVIHLGRALGLSVSRSAGAHPGHARPVRSGQARLGLRHAERRALLHLQTEPRLREALLLVPNFGGEGPDPRPERRRAHRVRGLMGLRIGIDIGGTFTDLVFLDEKGGVSTRKVLSTSEDFSQGIVNGLSADTRIDTEDIAQLMHGTTVATNAILEGKGARVGLITTLGFRDVLEIRRLRMPALYDIRWQKPPPLVPRRLRLEIPERINAKGEVERALDEEAAASAVDRLLAAGADAIAVCLINAYANGAHETLVRDLIHARDAGMPVTLSSELIPEIKENERTSTTGER